MRQTSQEGIDLAIRRGHKRPARPCGVSERTHRERFRIGQRWPESSPASSRGGSGRRWRRGLSAGAISALGRAGPRAHERHGCGREWAKGLRAAAELVEQVGRACGSTGMNSACILPATRRWKNAGRAPMPPNDCRRSSSHPRRAFRPARAATSGSPVQHGQGRRRGYVRLDAQELGDLSRPGRQLYRMVQQSRSPPKDSPRSGSCQATRKG